MDYLDALARHLHDRELLTYDPNGDVTGDCFIETMPRPPTRRCA